MIKKDLINLFKALGEETKFDIIKVLINGEVCACDISKQIGKTQSNTSMQLIKLKDLGLLKSRKNGKQIIYSINNNNLIKIFELFDLNNKDKINNNLNLACDSKLK